VTRLAIVDDQELVRAGFRAILETQADFDVVGEAGNGVEAVELARRVSCDVMLMDVRMPVLDGIEATRRIGLAAPATRILILTTFDLDQYVYEAMTAGASGFLLKDVPREELIGGVRTVARGEALLAPAVTSRLIERFVRLPRPGVVPSQLSALSARELDVLRLVAKGMSNAEIAEQLVVSPATVKTHVASFLAKLDLRDRVQAVVLAYESGLVEPGSNVAT
jgi:DNA-binding NarL/FixJ family response regulator